MISIVQKLDVKGNDVVIHRFADFVEGSPHLISNEVSVHAQEYGSFFEDDFFDTDEDNDEENMVNGLKKGDLGWNDRDL